MNPETFKYLLIGVVSLSFLVEKFLSYLNHNQPVPKIPETLDSYLDREKLIHSKVYQTDNFRFGLYSGIFSFVLTVIFLWQGWFGLVDNWVIGLVTSPLLQSFAFFGIIFIGSDLVSFPFDYYSTFVIEEKYGFNKTNRKTFILDKIKGYTLSIVIGGGLLLVFLWLVHQMGSDFWWQFWLIAAVFMVFVNLFYMAWILPLFNKLTPLQEGELKSQLIHYARSVNFPLRSIFVMDGSKRSSKANAFFSGFGKRKMVVLYDTLLDQHPPDELVAILAHEVGHYKKKHLLLGMITSVLHVGFLLF